METLPQPELLQKLHANLAHFDHAPAFGDEAEVAVIKSFLQLRIREAESQVLHCCSLVRENRQHSNVDL